MKKDEGVSVASTELRAEAAAELSKGRTVDSAEWIENYVKEATRILDRRVWPKDK